MTGQQFVNNLATLTNDRNKSFLNDSELLFLLNMGRRELASQLLLFAKWETINLLSSTSDYTLESEVVQIISATDSNGYDRPINYGDDGLILSQDIHKNYVENSIEATVILKIAPNKIRVQDPSYNNENDDVYLDINYYYIPDDLALSDVIDITTAQTDILYAYARADIATRPSMVTGEVDLSMRNYHKNRYEELVANYRANNPTTFIKTTAVNRLRSGGYI